MTPPAAPLVDDPDAIRRLRGNLDGAGFNGAAIKQALNLDQALEVPPGDTAVHARRLTGDSAFEVAVRLFWLGASVRPDDVARAIPNVSPDTLVDLGVLERTDEAARARVRLIPFDPLILACDRVDDSPGGLPPDHVAGVHRPSVMLADLTVRDVVDTALDVATGNGIQALLAAAHARHVVAADINRRALQFAAFNAILNDVRNLEIREGSFFEPVRGERFDLVTCNPPYVISPETRYLYRDSGMRGDAVSEGVLRDMPLHLAEGAFGHALVSWLHGAAQPWQEPLDVWLADSGCDAWYLHLISQDPLTAAAAWNIAGGTGDPAEVGATIDAWLAYYTELGVERVAYGGVVMRRRAPGPSQPNWQRPEEMPEAPVNAAADQIRRVFAVYDAYTELSDDERLLGSCLALDPAHRLDQVVRPGPAGYVVESTVLRLEAGIPFRGPVDPLIVEVLSGMDGRRALRDVVADAARRSNSDARDAWAVLAPVVRRLLELGVLYRV